MLLCICLVASFMPVAAAVGPQISAYGFINGIGSVDLLNA